MTADFAPFLARALRPADPRFACVECVAAALPNGCKLATAHGEFVRLPLSVKIRALRSPLASARYVARRVKALRARPDGPAWGVVEAGDGRQAFALRFDGERWFALSLGGVCRVSPDHVLAAWEIV